MVGDVLDGHAAAQVQSVALEGLGRTAAGSRKRHLGPLDAMASAALDALDIHVNPGGPTANGKTAKPSPTDASANDLVGPAGRADQPPGQYGEMGLAGSIFGLDVPAATKAEGVIQ
jgi:hypothetical protein